jgi:hypothetical protein
MPASFWTIRMCAGGMQKSDEAWRIERSHRGQNVSHKIVIVIAMNPFISSDVLAKMII